jgi:hypothetical protein
MIFPAVVKWTPSHLLAALLPFALELLKAPPFPPPREGPDFIHNSLTCPPCPQLPPPGAVRIGLVDIALIAVLTAFLQIALQFFLSAKPREVVREGHRETAAEEAESSEEEEVEPLGGQAAREAEVSGTDFALLARARAVVIPVKSSPPVQEEAADLQSLALAQIKSLRKVRAPNK